MISRFDILDGATVYEDGSDDFKAGDGSNEIKLGDCDALEAFGEACVALARHYRAVD